MSARATKSATDRASEVEASEYDTAQLLHAPLMLYGAPRPRPILIAPYYCTRTSIVRPGRAPRDDKGKVGRTNKLPSHRYKTLVRLTPQLDS
ncbi:hypothetical protein B296_00049111 [Ensete ventricosum]|uniref:Uncharacterized protein n=1 Tax=Ensete ventricosum TaxID=4639 RepID=A0A426XCV7_ENSVE|nr:hypothetical protein B296_00049111 [Ensete ventricosum]